jgi:LacI family transcriptional regulator
MRAADEQGLLVTLGITLRSPQREVEYLAVLRAQRARAVILAGSRFADAAIHQRLLREIEAFRASGGRVALISQRRLPVDTVVPENRSGARALARELLARGHRRFGVLRGPAGLQTARDRLAGFKQGLAEHGIELAREAVVSSDLTRDGGYEAAERLLARDTGATCIFALSDVMAVGAMAALHAHGLVVGEDISVAGFDDITSLRDVTPSLTTVRLPLERMGAQALRMVLDEPSETPRLVSAHGEVVLRDSTPRLT